MLTPIVFLFRCQATLSECLQKIEVNPEKVDFCNLINIVVVHCQSSDMLIKATALPWMSKFITLSGQVLLPFFKPHFTCNRRSGYGNQTIFYRAFKAAGA